MDKRKLGIVILIFSVILGVVVINLISNSQEAAREGGCFQEECGIISSTLSMSHLGIGILFSLFSLGIYLLIFGRTEEALLKQLKEQKHHIAREDKLRLVHLLLSENEQKVFNVILEHEGITQNSLRIKTDLSKATVSQILSDFERKNIIAKDVKGKTYAIYLKNPL